MAIRLKGVAPTAGQPDKRYYQIDVQEGYRRVRLSTGTRDKVAALNKEQAVLDALREDIDTPEATLRVLVQGKARLAARHSAANAPRQRTLKEAMDSACGDRNVWAKRRSLPTIRANCNTVLSYMGEAIALEAVNQAAVDTMLDAMDADEVAPATQNRKMHALMAVLRLEVKAGRRTAPLPEYKPHDERDNARVFTLTLEDENLILERVLLWDHLPEASVGGRPRKRDAQDYQDLFVFLADVGCRLTQAFNLKWSDFVVTHEKCEVRFWRHGELKGGMQRTIPLTSRVAAVIRRRKLATIKDHAGPFSMLEKTRASKLWRRAIKGTHLEHETECVIHSLRHTCATRLLQLTGNIKLVQEWLGHRDIRTTSTTYAKVLSESKLAGVSVLESYRVAGAPEAAGDIPRQGLIAKAGVK